MTTTQMRARYRRSVERELLVAPGTIEEYDFDNFAWVASRISKGSRLRIVLTSPNSIFTDRNYISGGSVANESGKDARNAHIVLYHDAARPTFLELPVTP